jgi:hypothetical protein
VLVACGLAVALSASACASKYQKVEDSFAQPINCSTARADIQDLHAEKVDKATEAVEGLKFALPTTIVRRRNGGIQQKDRRADRQHKVDLQPAVGRRDVG